MALTRKNLMVDAEQLANLAARRGLSESAVVREAIADALFADEFMIAMTVLRETGYGEEGEKSNVSEGAAGTQAERAS